MTPSDSANSNANGSNVDEKTELSMIANSSSARTSRIRKAPSSMDNYVESGEAFNAAYRSMKKRIKLQNSVKKNKEKSNSVSNTDISAPKIDKISKPITISKSKKRTASSLLKSFHNQLQKQENINITSESAEQIARRECEDKIIALAKSCHKRIKSHFPKSLPTGPAELADLKSAVKQGVQECSTLILDWSSESGKRIGARCKVYWDGDDTWFYGRILNYDSYYDRYYVSLSITIVDI